MAPIRVLHVLGSMQLGGIQVWLMNVLQHLDPRRFKIDIVISTLGESPLATEAENLGAKIHVCRRESRPLQYGLNLANTIRKNGPYDIIHGNLHHMNGMVCIAAALAGVPVRIAHSHTLLSDTEGGRYRLARRAIRRFANGALACSETSGRALFGLDWKESLNGRTYNYGINLEQFRVKPDRSAVRAALGIPRDAIVIGHLGRFVPEKNHTFWLDIAESYSRNNLRAHFLLLGDGPLLPEMKARAAALPMADRFHFPGIRFDVPKLLEAMDAFLFPSRVEGLPLALIEAQAAGLPCVFSDFIEPEVDVYPGILARMSLNKPPEEWGKTIKRMMSKSRPETRTAAFRAVELSSFNPVHSIEELEQYYLRLYNLIHSTAQQVDKGVASISSSSQLS